MNVFDAYVWKHWPGGFLVWLAGWFGAMTAWSYSDDPRGFWSVEILEGVFGVRVRNGRWERHGKAMRLA